ncbi:MAG: tetratricopeptide repeat protein [Candidatus Melainabacteria bacterium]|nr:MAG: tetratricopeptide repeat protein [Candidatus Melainabacteria bacterium]
MNASPFNSFRASVAKTSVLNLSCRLLLGASLLCGWSYSAALPALSQSIAEADEYLIKNRFKEAEDAYRALLQSDDTGDSFAGLAVALAKQEIPAKITEAERILRQAREKFPDNPNVIAAGGYVSYVHSQTVASPAKRDLFLEAAENLCKRAIKANPDILIAQQTLGLVKMAQDDVESAVEPFRKSVGLAENPVNLTLLAQALLKIDPKDKEAEQIITKVVHDKPDYAQARMQKAIILNNSGKPEDAYMELHNIPADKRKEMPEWNTVKGDICKKQGDGPGALAAYREAIRLDPHMPDPYRHLAEYYAQRGDGEMAIAHMHDALEILPNDMQMRNDLAELALRQDKLDVAETEYKTILATQPDDANALLGMTRVCNRKARKDGQYPPDFEKIMEQLRDIMSEKAVTSEKNVSGQVIKSGAKSFKEKKLLAEAETALTQHHFRDARKCFSTVISEHKDEPYELISLGEQAFNDGDFQSAEQAYSLAKEIPEVAPRAEQGMSRIVTQRNEAARQTKLGDATWKLPTVAIDHYKQALIADPQYPDAYYGLFSIFTKGDNPEPDKAHENAICFLEAADESNPLRQEVETGLLKLKKHDSGKPKKKK